ncbi:predicted protein [Plenodomus lingam JN3]|uniref:Predicted protein n=1 Tax=Leptosphaeria maculans (strain JN3 / isolate v23.1.3 / race Av1-4-5-6-7-8) TaxID=985895 RepID=E4ZSW5_LEPMJ|nr:predicted protein [Plenodomus lingam JN3]CBX94553.1 predicted protein [Plenodomus lingam JN3]
MSTTPCPCPSAQAKKPPVPAAAKKHRAWLSPPLPPPASLTEISIFPPVVQQLNQVHARSAEGERREQRKEKPPIAIGLDLSMGFPTKMGNFWV